MRNEGIRELMQAIGLKVLGEMPKEEPNDDKIDLTKKQKKKDDKCCK